MKINTITCVDAVDVISTAAIRLNIDSQELSESYCQVADVSYGDASHTLITSERFCDSLEEALEAMEVDFDEEVIEELRDELDDTFIDVEN